MDTVVGGGGAAVAAVLLMTSPFRMPHPSICSGCSSSVRPSMRKPIRKIAVFHLSNVTYSPCTKTRTQRREKPWHGGHQHISTHHTSRETTPRGFAFYKHFMGTIQLGLTTHARYNEVLLKIHGRKLRSAGAADPRFFYTRYNLKRTTQAAMPGLVPPAKITSRSNLWRTSGCSVCDRKYCAANNLSYFRAHCTVGTN